MKKSGLSSQKICINNGRGHRLNDVILLDSSGIVSAADENEKNSMILIENLDIIGFAYFFCNPAGLFDGFNYRSFLDFSFGRLNPCFVW